MADQIEDGLLGREYNECPGCTYEQLKQTRRGVPIMELASIWIVVLCAISTPIASFLVAALPIASIFPYLYFMIEDFHIAESDEDIGYYAGYVASSFMFGRALTSVFWGVIADKYGRKPVITYCIASVVIINTLFGLSVNFWMAVGTRFLQGVLNGLLGPINAYATEICREEHQGLGLSVISSAWGIGLIIGTILGGFLSQPAEKYPNLFSKTSVFGRFPYFLPCLCISLFSLGVTILSLWLPETLHMHKRTDFSQEHFYVESPRIKSESEKGEHDDQYKSSTSGRSLIQNWPLISSIFVYCIFCLHDMAYTEVFSLWAISPRSHGGLSYTTQEVGIVLAFSGLGLLIFQLGLYPYMERLFGAVTVARLAAALSICLLTCYPLIARLSGLSLAIVLNITSIAKNVLSESIMTSLILLQNKAVKQHERGVANGISMTGMSIFKAIGPLGGGSVFSWAQKHQHARILPGDQMIFFGLNVVEFIALILTFKPFLNY